MRNHRHALFRMCCAAFVFIVMLRAVQAGEWNNISEPVYQKLQDEGKEQRGIKRSGGLTVDPATGDVYMLMCGQGIWKSTDQGESFTRIDDGTFQGRCETGGAFNVAPDGKRIVMATVYGPSALITDGGKSIEKFSSGHFDYIAVDWAHDAQTMLAMRHESGQMLTLTSDGGQTWHDLGKGFDGFCVGVFDADTLIASRGDGLLRSVDRGKNWKKVSSAQPTSPVVIVRGATGYLLTKEGLLVSKDQGATWSTQGSPVEGSIGPVFGKDASHMFVVGNGGVMETSDAGQNWAKAAPQPPDYPRIGNLGRTVTPTLAYDVKRNILYISRLAFPAYRLQR